MKVIMKETNEIKDVAFGHAVNYLIPQGKAVLATSSRVKKLKEEKAQKEEKRKKKRKKQKKLAEQLSGRRIKIKKKAGKSGKLFGSVSEADIKKALGEEDFQVLLDEAIKEVGEYQVELKMGPEKAKIKVEVESRE